MAYPGSQHYHALIAAGQVRHRKAEIQKSLEGMSVDEYNEWLLKADSADVFTLYDGSVSRATQAVEHAMHRSKQMAEDNTVTRPDGLSTSRRSKTEKFNYPKGLNVDVLPKTSANRKAIPLASGVLDYFPAALAEVAKVSKAGNDKHNPGEPMHHARGKSTDHADSIARHLLERGGVDPDTGVLHSAELAWRALALLQQELEDAGAPVARGARLPEGEDKYDRAPTEYTPGQIVEFKSSDKFPKPIWRDIPKIAWQTPADTIWPDRVIPGMWRRATEEEARPSSEGGLPRGQAVGKLAHAGSRRGAYKGSWVRVS